MTEAVSNERLMEAQRITKGHRTQAVGDLGLAPGVLAGVIRNSFADARARGGLLRSLWVEVKRFGARNVRTIELSRLRGIDQIYVDGPVIRHSMLVLSALAALLECETIFEFGSVDALTPALLAHNLAKVRIYSFDRPSETRSWQARASRDSPDPKITRLSGDSATFDFSPYSGKVDLVHIDAGDRPASLVADTEAAFGMLSELGSIVWYGFTYHPALYAFLERLAPSLDRPIHHLAGTRLALYSRWDVVVPDE
jgi:predicted O-methyltransferase YrrM